MDINSNKTTGKRKAQTIQEMINNTPSNGQGLKRSGYAGPKSGPNAASMGRTSSLR